MKYHHAVPCVLLSCAACTSERTYWEAWVHEYCSWQVQCPSEYFPPDYTTVSACERDYWEFGFVQGYMRSDICNYHPGRAHDCMETLADWTCYELPFAYECPGMYTNCHVLGDTAR